MFLSIYHFSFSFSSWKLLVHLAHWLRIASFLTRSLVGPAPFLRYECFVVCRLDCEIIILTSDWFDMDSIRIPPSHWRHALASMGWSLVVVFWLPSMCLPLLMRYYHFQTFIYYLISVPLIFIVFQVDNEATPFYGIPDNAKSLLEEPTKVLQIKDVVCSSFILSMHECF